MKWLYQRISKTQYYGVFDTFRIYWSIYGGARAILASPYFHISLLITWLSKSIWSQVGWWEDVIGVLPDLLGFSLGGYAIWLTIGDSRLKKILGGSDSHSRDGASPFLEMSVAFAHFIVLQIGALMVAVVAKAVSFDWPFPSVADTMLNCYYGITDHDIKVLLSGVGYWMFIYAIATAFAACFAILHFSIFYDEYLGLISNEDEDDDEEDNKTN